MTKRILSLILSFLCIFAVSGCEKKSKTFIPGSPQNIAWATEIYEKVLETMPQKSYIANTNGSGIVNTAGIDISLKISGKTLHTPNEIYFENMSNGDAILGINTSFAKRVYFYAPSPEQTIYRLASTQGKKQSIDENGNIIIYEHEWDKASDITQSDYQEKFGKPINRLSNYVINKDTILANSSGVISHDNEQYVFQFVLDVANGISSPAVAGYVKQIYTMSQRKCISFDYVTVTFTTSKDYRILQYSVEESYTVSAGIVKPTTKNNINYTFEYPETLKVKSF